MMMQSVEADRASTMALATQGRVRRISRTLCVVALAWVTGACMGEYVSRQGPWMALIASGWDHPNTFAQ